MAELDLLPALRLAPMEPGSWPMARAVGRDAAELAELLTEIELRTAVQLVREIELDGTATWTADLGDDLTANGIIVDQGGSGLPISSVLKLPTLGERSLVLLGALLAAFAILRRCTGC